MYFTEAGTETGAGAATPRTDRTNRTKRDCAPSPAGCLRCQAVKTFDRRESTITGPAGPTVFAAPFALWLGGQDVDAVATLRQALEASNIGYRSVGDLLIVPLPSASPSTCSSPSSVPPVSPLRYLNAIIVLLKKCLSPYTLSCIRAAYAPDVPTVPLATFDQGSRGGSVEADRADQLALLPPSLLSALLFAEPLSQMGEQWEHAWVREALADHWLFSLFQPIVDARTGTPFAYEALLRAQVPASQEVLGAGPLLAACEALNLQHQLDQQARRAAIHGAAALNLPDSVRFFINFLPNTIYDPAICLRTTMEAADEAGMALSRLVFEVVETESIPDMNRLKHILEYYRERGVGTAVDDMGAGFTSIEYLETLRPDYAKLDRDLVWQAEGDREARQKLNATVAAARRLDIRVIAEGIETEAQMNLCVEAGADYLQGYLFARPACPPQKVHWPDSLGR